MSILTPRVSAASLDRLRAILEAQVVPCPDEGENVRTAINGRHIDFSFGYSPIKVYLHTKCGGTGRLPDPAFAPLLALVRVECGCGCHRNTLRSHQQHYAGCPPWEGPDACNGYLTRTWQAAPVGALAGALQFAIPKPLVLGVGELDSPDDTSTAYWALVGKVTDGFYEVAHAKGSDPDQVAVDTLIAALEGGAIKEGQLC